MTAPAPAGTAITVDPTTIATDKNVRTDLKLEKDFLESLRQHGVLQPPAIYWSTQLEQYQVLIGHRRVAGAVQVGLDAIPCYVVDEPTGDDLRIIEQMVENVQREQLTGPEQAAAYKQLALFGMPAIQIAKRTGTKLAHVGDAITVADSPEISAALEEKPMDLTHAAAIVEFADDPQTVERLTQTASTNPSQFAHELHSAKTARAKAVLHNQLIEQLIEEKTALAERPNQDTYSSNKNKHQPLDILVDKATDEKITPEAHRACPGHAAYVGQRGWNRDEEIIYLCTDPAKYGHRNTMRASAAPVSDAERAKRKKDRENKAEWLEATEVRHAFITDTLLATHPVPKTADLLIAQHLAGVAFTPTDGSQRSTASKWLGLSDYDYRSSDYYGFARYLAEHPDRARTVALAVAIAAMEAVIGVPKGDTKGWDDNRGKVGPYLELLESWGYGLSAIERRVITADTKRNAKKVA